jgi:hypothetical protein
MRVSPASKVTALILDNNAPVRVENKANFQLQEEYTRWEAVSPAGKLTQGWSDFELKDGKST